MKKLVLLMMILMSLGVKSAIAQPADDDEQLDTDIQQFGYVSGVVFQCAAGNETEAKSIERDVMKAFTGITRLFGSDRAFFYAAAYGVGATGPIDRSKCAEDTRQFRELMKKNPLTQGN